MPLFEISIPGRMYSYWPDDKEIHFNECKFEKGEKEFEFIVKTNVDAENIESAREEGREKCQDAIDLLKFCIGEPLELSNSVDHIREHGAKVSTGTCSIQGNAIIVNRNPVRLDQLDMVSNVNNILKQKDQNERKLLSICNSLALEGRDISISKTDRYGKIWDALESLAGKDNKIPKEIFSIYPNVNKQKVYELINKLKDIRGEIHHEAARNPDNLDERLEQIDNIFTDILRHKLNLECKKLSKKYFI